MKRGLVLSGGGLAGQAWELGVLQGISDISFELGANLMAADLLVGTSAGAAVAAKIAGSAPLSELYAAQLNHEQTLDGAEVLEEMDVTTSLAQMAASLGDPEGVENISRLALSRALLPPAHPEAGTILRSALLDGLPSTWPDRALLITAIEVESGDFTIFTRDSGISLQNAVTASCCIAEFSAPVPFNGNLYVDGGGRSTTNADLAAGCDRVVVLTHTTPDAPVVPWDNLDDEIDRLKPATVHVVYADREYVAATGCRPLAPSARPLAAESGRETGRASAAAIAAIWY